jgi:hypothetical protein
VHYIVHLSINEFLVLQSIQLLVWYDGLVLLYCYYFSVHIANIAFSQDYYPHILHVASLAHAQFATLVFETVVDIYLCV